jgi:hypothetical protein
MNKKLLNYMVSVGKLLPRVASPEDEENTVEPDEKPLGEESQIRTALRSVVSTSKHPLVRPDLLDAATLLYLLKRDGAFPRLTAWSLAKELRSWYFRPVGPIQYCYRRLNVWTTLPVQPLRGIVKLIHQRVSEMPGVSLDVRGGPSTSRPLAP